MKYLAWCSHPAPWSSLSTEYFHHYICAENIDAARREFHRQFPRLEGTVAVRLHWLRDMRGTKLVREPEPVTPKALGSKEFSKQLRDYDAAARDYAEAPAEKFERKYSRPALQKSRGIKRREQDKQRPSIASQAIKPLKSKFVGITLGDKIKE